MILNRHADSAAPATAVAAGSTSRHADDLAHLTGSQLRYLVTAKHRITHTATAAAVFVMPRSIRRCRWPRNGPRYYTVHPDVGGTDVEAAAISAAYTELRSAVRRAEILDLLDTQLEHTIRDHAPGTGLLRGSDERSYAPSIDRGTVSGLDPGVGRERAERLRDARVGSVRRPERTAAGMGPPPVRAPLWLLVRVLLAATLPVVAYLVRADDLPTWITLALAESHGSLPPHD